MGLRITTWNVNGIRNPFAYQPWRDKRTFEGMFDILEADIVVFQETKIQRKDLRDDMVLVPGWDCYFSLPKYKKGYSGVVIYTRNSTCSPIRAEEGITGVLSPPNTSTSFKELPDDQRIGGYPTAEQLSQSEVDAATLDSEGRCVILEFPAFIVIGTYCPAARDETRDDFRLGFLNVLDSRIRNLIAMGKRVIWTGDLNISREELDTAAAEESMRKNGMTGEEYVSTPSRRLFNQLLVRGKVIGERDEGREKPVMWDICRGFHEGRKGMFTCWETKVNARPGNYGARIDYVLCSTDMKDWFCDSNIQEGLLGSDHCPVYATLKDKIVIEGEERFAKDLMNPPGMFVEGNRVEDWSVKNLLPLSGKLIPEFDRRRNIRDMFGRKPSMLSEKSGVDAEKSGVGMAAVPVPSSVLDDIPKLKPQDLQQAAVSQSTPKNPPSPSRSAGGKRTQKADGIAPSAKRSKSGSQSTNTNGVGKGQRSLKGFFSARTTASVAENAESAKEETTSATTSQSSLAIDSFGSSVTPSTNNNAKIDSSASPLKKTSSTEQDLVDPIVSKESWGKLFAKPTEPRCQHDEPCKTMLTKKPGINCGRSFWMCQRPLGPSGSKEKGTQWRCATFIWCSDRSGGDD